MLLNTRIRMQTNIICLLLFIKTPHNTENIFTDNGIGIKDDHKARLFEMFYRATENTDESGLGLYIVKQTVERMKGRIAYTGK